MRIVWSLFAVSDREAIFSYIKADSPRTAAGVDDRIEKQVDALADFPESGRPGRVVGTRELVVRQTPYIVAYEIGSGTVKILRVLHGAQQWPSGFEERQG